MEKKTLVDDLIESMKITKTGFLFWTCPNGCRGIVDWHQEDDKHIATCRVCGMTNRSTKVIAIDA
jgi:hypothetical protein